MKGKCLNCDKYLVLNDIGICSKCMDVIDKERQCKERELLKGCECPIQIIKEDDTGKYCASCGKNI